MNEKLSFQNIVDALTQHSNIQKKVAESFAKAFFDTIIDALRGGEDVVKIKGLGTFKLVSVEPRESVNVSNGERIVIPGYKKVSFTADDTVMELLNKKEGEMAESVVEVEKFADAEQPAEMDEPIIEEPVKEKEEATDEIEELIQVPEPEKVELPQNDFAGIDLLISTPESVEEVRQQYEDAKSKMETAVEEARRANAEKVRLEKLLERLESNATPEEKNQAEAFASSLSEEEESDSTVDVETEKTMVEEQMQATNTSIEKEKRQEAFNRVMAPASPEKEKKEDDAEEVEKKEVRKRIWIVVLVLMLLGAVAFFLVRTFYNIEKVEKVPEIEKKTKTVKPAPKVNEDSLKLAIQKADSIKAVETAAVEAARQDSIKRAEDVAKPKEPARPSIHKMQKGESLTRISQMYYGTKDSVRAIIRVNTFADPNNVPVGAVVKLP